MTVYASWDEVKNTYSSTLVYSSSHMVQLSHCISILATWHHGAHSILARRTLVQSSLSRCSHLHNPCERAALQREFGVGCAGHGQSAVPGVWGQRPQGQVSVMAWAEKQSHFYLAAFPATWKSNKAGEGTRKQVLWGVTERIGFI